MPPTPASYDDAKLSVNSGVSSAKPLKLKDEAFQVLELMIVNGELEPGQWVSETDLIELSGHSRASVRSAVQRLSNEGLLRIVHRRGAQICPIDFEQHFRSLELRRVVEVLIAKSAAKRATDEQRAAFIEIAELYRPDAGNEDYAAMIDLDQRQFALMLEAADNEFAARSLSSVKGLSRRFWVLNKDKYGDSHKMISDHLRVARAIASGDETAAETAVNDLIDYVEKFTLEAIGYSGKAL